jgi:hypothetical protein
MHRNFEFIIREHLFEKYKTPCVSSIFYSIINPGLEKLLSHSLEKPICEENIEFVKKLKRLSEILPN